MNIWRSMSPPRPQWGIGTASTIPRSIFNSPPLQYASISSRRRDHKNVYVVGIEAANQSLSAIVNYKSLFSGLTSLSFTSISSLLTFENCFVIVVKFVRGFKLKMIALKYEDLIGTRAVRSAYNTYTVLRRQFAHSNVVIIEQHCFLAFVFSIVSTCLRYW